MKIDKARLFEDLVEEYRNAHPKSEEYYVRALKSLISGGSHNLRLFSPYPFYDQRCQGSKVHDIDGHTYIDYWQGHFASVLGHNPEVVLETLSRYMRNNQGLITGFPGLFQRELAELILERIPAERIRFTTSGSLATMYAIMLARSFTNRPLVLKIGGGWHGSQPYALKGISAYSEGFNMLESAGLPSEMDDIILTTKFNDKDDLAQKFRQFGDRIACLILEAFIGAGGFIFGDREYIQLARELTKQSGSLMIMDEVVSGFRFHAGGLQSIYQINPDLTVFGKAIGGGMPLSAVSGREDILRLCSPKTKIGERVRFDGGTYSAHPATMLAGLTYLRYLIEHEKGIYDKIGKFGQILGQGIEEIFKKHGFQVICTGDGDALNQQSSFIGVHFLEGDINTVLSPEEAWNPKVCDFELREKLFKIAMIMEGVNVFHGIGAVSFAHTEKDIEFTLNAVKRVAQKWKKYQTISKTCEQSGLG